MGDDSFRRANPKIRPTNSEFALNPNRFIYCEFKDCPGYRTGLCRVHTGPDMAKFCRKCNQPFPAKPNGKSHGYAHFQALLAGKPVKPGIPAGRSIPNANRNANGKSDGGNGRPKSELSRLTDVVSTLVGEIRATQSNRNHPSENAIPSAREAAGGEQSQGHGGTRWDRRGGGSGRQTQGSVDTASPKPPTPSDSSSFSPKSPILVSNEGSLEGPDTLAAVLAANYQLLPETASRIAADISANSKPIKPVEPPPKKYTAIYQSFSNAHQAANAAVGRARIALDTANSAYLAAIEAAELALEAAQSASKEFVQAKLHAQNTWNELQANSKYAKTAQQTNLQPEMSGSALSDFQAAIKLLEGINVPEMSGLVVGLKQFDVSKFNSVDTVADEDMPAAGAASPPTPGLDLEGTNVSAKNESVVGGEPVCLYDLDQISPSVVSPTSSHQPKECVVIKRSHDGSSGDDARFDVAHTGRASLQHLRNEHAKAESILAVADSAADFGAIAADGTDVNIENDRDVTDPYRGAAASGSQS